MTHTSHNDELFARAQLSIPGGVNSPVRAFRSVGGTPLFLVKAAGAYVTDSDGRDYVDLVSSWGPAILESVLSIRRAGADTVLTYWATELATTLS